MSLRGEETCPHCGYDLRATRSGARCPECGRITAVGEADRFVDQPLPLVVGAAWRLGVIAGLQLFCIGLPIAVFSTGWFQGVAILVGGVAALAAFALRSALLLSPPGTARFDRQAIVAALVVLPLLLVVAVVVPGRPIVVPWLLFAVVLLVAIASRRSIRTADWIEDPIAANFAQYAIQAIVLGLVVAPLSAWLTTAANAVTLLGLASLGWWGIQWIGDLVLAWSAVHSIGHRVKLDDMESRRRERDESWSDRMPGPSDR